MKKMIVAITLFLMIQQPGIAKFQTPTTPIEHFIVVMQENHSFDNYFGTYPGVDGIPPGTCMPVDPEDASNDTCVEPFHIGDMPVEDLSHNTETHYGQYRKGAMDGFINALSQNGRYTDLAMGYYDDREIPFYWNLADEYVLFDRFFSSAAGGSVNNHLYWVSGQPGNLEDEIPPGGWTGIPTIFDRLEEAGISWKFYVENYDPTITILNRVLGDRGAQVVWVPLLAYPRYIEDPELFSHIVHLDEYYEDLANDTLPAVAYIVPSGASEHPPGSIRAGQRFTKNMINALMRSSAWGNSAFMITYDDWGGWYDHVAPPVVDEYGYGFRVPAFLVSPYAKRGHIDNTTLDYTSILKFIEENWGLQPLASRDASANSIASAFAFDQPPRAAEIIPGERSSETDDPPQREIIYVAYGFAILIPLSIMSWAILQSRRRYRGNSRYQL